MCWWDTFIYSEMITTVGLVNFFIIWHNNHFFFVMRACEICSLSNFQICSIAFWTIVTMLCIRVPELIRLRKFEHFVQNLPTSPNPQPLTTTILPSAFIDFIYKWNIEYLSFSVWLISLSLIHSKSIRVVTNRRIFFFLMAE